MNTRQFTDELLHGLTLIERFDQVVLHSEGPVVNGQAFVNNEANIFLRFYYNSRTGTTAFALIDNTKRVWGIDFDNKRGWHLHPQGQPTLHVSIEPMSVTEILLALQDVLKLMS